MENQGRKLVMPQSAKHFAQRLNHCLDDMGVPANIRDRAAVLSKMLDIPRQQAWGMLEGHQLPDPHFLLQVAAEFEVDPQWLSGEK